MKENIETLLEENNQRKKFNIEDRKKIEFLETENKRLKLQNDNLNDVSKYHSITLLDYLYVGVQVCKLRADQESFRQR